MIQQIAGRPIFISGCIPHGRKFTSRILATLCVMEEGAWVTLSRHFKDDLLWFVIYSEQANSIYLCNTDKPLLQIKCDSSLKAGGGNGGDSYYAWEYTPSHTEKFPKIYMLEAINIVVAYKTLTPQFDTQPAAGCLSVADVTEGYWQFA